MLRLRLLSLLQNSSLYFDIFGLVSFPIIAKSTIYRAVQSVEQPFLTVGGKRFDGVIIFSIFVKDKNIIDYERNISFRLSNSFWRADILSDCGGASAYAVHLVWSLDGEHPDCRW
jgi:hypothetical protein